MTFLPTLPITSAIGINNKANLGDIDLYGIHLDYWFSFTSGSTELYNKLATRGDVYDLYYIQSFNKFLSGRIGYTYVDYDYSLSGFQIGDFGDSSEELRNAYFLIDCRF